MGDRSQARCVLVQPQVATVLMIVADVSSHEPDEMTRAENHDVLKELATAAADPPLRSSVLPWAAKRSANGFCARCFDELDDPSAKDEVAIEDEIFRSGVVGKRLTQLLNNPSRRRVERGVEVNDVPTAVLDDEEAVQQLERSGGHGEQIHGGDIVFMVAQESHPSLQLVGLRGMPRQVSRHRNLGDDETELGELSMDAWRPPAVLRHRADEATNLGINPGPTGMAALRDLCPVPSESVAMPTGYGVRVDDEQAARPHGPRTSKGNPESPFRVVERWAWALFLQRRHLLPQSDVLQHQVGAAPRHRPNGTDAK